MSAEIKKEIQLEIAHVLFIDIVGYSKLSINEQRTAIDELTQVVRRSEQFQNAEAGARLIKMTTGVGPVVSYAGQFGKMPFAAEVKWLPQTGTRNTLNGDYIWFKVGVQF